MVDKDALLLRLVSVEDRIRSLQLEVAAIRAELAAPTVAATAPAPPQTQPPREPFPTARPKRDPWETLSAPPRPARPAAPPKPPKPRREIDLADLFGAQALAWAGGVVTLLGVIFFFVLAVNRGWIGPIARVGCGAVASALVFGGGLWLRRRYAETYSALAAVGAGIAGGYATLAAATVLYDLVPKPAALVVAPTIAAAALAVALAWRAELVAALGLVGAIAAPALLAIDGGLTATGTGFAAVMTAAACAVGVRMRWRWLLIAAAAASAPQVLALVVDAPRDDAGAIALACSFGLLYLATGIAEQFATGDEALLSLPVAFVLGSIAIAWVAAAQLFGPARGSGAGWALLVAAAAFATATVAVWVRRQRELGTLLGTIGLAAAAVGVADLLTGPTLAYTFAAEGVVLAVASRRLREPRVLLGAIGYLALALGHALLFDTPPSALFEAARHPASGSGTLASAAVAALAVAWTTRTAWRESRERGVLRFLAPVVDVLRTYAEELRLAAGTLAAVLVADVVSLLVLELFEAVWQHGGVVASFHRGQVAVTMLWSLAGLAAVVLTRRNLIAFLWLALTALKVVAYDGSQLIGLAFGLAFLSIAVALLLAGFLDRRERPGVETIMSIGGAVAFACASTHALDGEPGRGLALLAIAVVLIAFAAPVFRRFRDLSTLLWAPALGVAAVAFGLLLHGTWLTLAWSAVACALAALAVTTREQRLQVATCAYVVLSAGAALVHAPPSHLVVASTHPARGILDLLLLAAAAVAFAWAAAELRTWSLWVAGAVVVYAASLGILELAVRVSSASLHTDFQRGHSGVSALWGALGLALVYVGLTRHRRALRLGGFALFAISLVKLFLYDLSQLSSVTRALSFLAVGAVLLLAGFFVQRLTSQLAEDEGPPPPAYS